MTRMQPKQVNWVNSVLVPGILLLAVIVGAIWIAHVPTICAGGMAAFAIIAVAYQVYWMRKGAYFPTILSPGSEWLDSWVNSHDGWIIRKFKPVENETILFPITPCFITTRGVLSFSKSAGDVIVTDKRIVLGYQAFIIETFSISMWHRDAKPTGGWGIPFGKYYKQKIESISLGADASEPSLGKYAEIKTTFPKLLGYMGVPITMRIYHPEAEGIAGHFSKPL